MMTPEEIRRYFSEHPDPSRWPDEVRGFVLGAMDTCSRAEQDGQSPRQRRNPFRRVLVAAVTPVQRGWTAARRLMEPVPGWMRLVIAGTAAAVIAFAVLWGTGTFVASPYAQAWCGPVENAMHPPKGTFGSFMTGLSRVQAQGAPVGQIIADEQQAETDNANYQNADALSAVSDNFVVLADLHKIGSDMRKLNGACGLAPGWNVSTIAVPLSGKRTTTGNGETACGPCQVGVQGFSRAESSRPSCPDRRDRWDVTYAKPVTHRLQACKSDTSSHLLQKSVFFAVTKGVRTNRPCVQNWRSGA